MSPLYTSSLGPDELKKVGLSLHLFSLPFFNLSPYVYVFFLFFCVFSKLNVDFQDSLCLYHYSYPEFFYNYVCVCVCMLEYRRVWYSVSLPLALPLVLLTGTRAPMMKSARAPSLPYWAHATRAKPLIPLTTNFVCLFHNVDLSVASIKCVNVQH